MKILIQNYTTPTSSEPYYLSNGINSHPSDHQSGLWEVNRYSAYDMLDRTEPDILICHFGLMNKDIVKYLSTNQEKNIKVILSISGLESQEDLDKLESIIDQFNINCLFMISNAYDFMESVKPKKHELFKLLPAANIDEIQISTPKFNIDSAVLAVENSEEYQKLCSKKEVYHKIKISHEKDPDFDFFVNTVTMKPIYRNYKNITLCGKTKDLCGQIFFDSILNSEDVSLKIQDSENLSKFLSEILDEEDVDESNILEKIKSQVMLKHTSNVRSKQLLKKIEEKVK